MKSYFRTQSLRGIEIDRLIAWERHSSFDRGSISFIPFLSLYELYSLFYRKICFFSKINMVEEKCLDWYCF